VEEHVRSWRRVPVAVGAALALAGGTLAVSMFPGTASAQQLPPTASAESACVDGVGAIRVTITDEDSYTYIVLIDEELVADGITDTDGTYEEFAPFDDGVYNVVVGWNDNEEYILDVDVTVDCAAEVTTTLAPTTTTVAVADAAVTAPAFTG
jgi:hypothetical protein